MKRLYCIMRDSISKRGSGIYVPNPFFLIGGCLAVSDAYFDCWEITGFQANYKDRGTIFLLVRLKGGIGKNTNIQQEGIQMNKKAQWAVRISAVVIAVALITGIALSSAGLINPDSGRRGRDTISLNGQSIRFRDIQMPPQVANIQTEPRPALPKVGDMEELLRLFNQMGALQRASFTDEKGTSNWGSADDMEIMDEMAVPEASMDQAFMTGTGGETSFSRMANNDSGGGYSQTNAQVQGVDEGDIVKTDGTYIYIAQSTQVSIVRAEGAAMEHVSTVKPENNAEVIELYVSGDRMVLVTSRYEERNNSVTDQPSARIWKPGRQFTGCAVYDITDRANPERVRLFEVEGQFLSTRLTGDTFCFAANRYVYDLVFDDLQEDDLLPLCRDTTVSPDARPLPVEEISYFPGSNEPSYLLLGAFDITGDTPCDIQSFLGAGQYFYMNQQSVYIANPEWNNDGNASALYRFSIDGVDIRFEGSGRVAGQPINQYCMDEYNGYFRIATTDWGKGSYVTVFDGTLNQVGQTPPLAPDESIQSMRFMGDEGYMVTFRQTDPLFSLDLSDPANPRVTGELKIPGFSSYMHPVGNGLMVGFGRHTLETFVRNDDGTETATGVMDAGMKISLFDVSDPINPLEIDKILLGDGSWSEATDNPRAMMVDASRGLFGFPVELSGWNPRTQEAATGHWSGAMLIGVEGRKLSIRAELKDGGDSWMARRLCYIDQTLYLCRQDAISAYSYENFGKLSAIDLPWLEQAVSDVELQTYNE